MPLSAIRLARSSPCAATSPVTSSGTSRPSTGDSWTAPPGRVRSPCSPLSPSPPSSMRFAMFQEESNSFPTPGAPRAPRSSDALHRPPDAGAPSDRSRLSRHRPPGLARGATALGARPERVLTSAGPTGASSAGGSCPPPEERIPGAPDGAAADSKVRLPRVPTARRTHSGGDAA